ncbi:MAG: CPBP family intramembrane metalloprotease [Clostridiales bacterium]|nr:CPBP family intramembrane metalloprotease [Clostridiales bacterium]
MVNVTQENQGYTDPAGEPAFSEKDRREARKCFSTLGLGCFAIVVVSSLAQIACDLLFSKWEATSWRMWVFAFAPIYVVGVPVGLLIFRRVPARGGAYANTKKISLKPGQFIRMFLIALFLANLGNTVGTILTDAISALTGIVSDVDITTYSMADSFFLKILFLVILAPMFEELVFRKQLIDRMSCYGERLAVVTTALMFGLFHGNISQFCYTFPIGLVFGYTYLKTGKLRYSLGMHMGYNFIGSVLTSTLINDVDLSALDNLDTLSFEALAPLALFLIYICAFLAATIVGLVLFLRRRKKVSFVRAEMELPKGSKFRTVYLNTGMLLFVLSSIVLIVISAVVG